MNDTSAYQPYAEAKWGLMNHWYPALFSAELAEDGGAGAPVVGVQIAGVPIVLRRVDGVAYALRDECLHRGVKLSLQPTCLTRSTLTCWYHGFTYDLADGRLSAIVVSPEDPLIGQVQLQSYPVVERNGLVFVFVGDADFGSPPPLESDLPPMVDAASRHWSPHLADDGAIVLGIRRRVASNWRLGCENGFDPGHIFIHRNTTLVRAQGWNMPLGLRPVGSAAVSWLEADDGPNGVGNEFGSDAYLPVAEHPELGLHSLGDATPAGSRTSMWMPCCLHVENFPQRGLAQFEFYVPVDDQTHESTGS
jgi:phenylpropionate dioxygenase-like ring-hydroxylating dioxygenase large terminal subunit